MKNTKTKKQVSKSAKSGRAVTATKTTKTRRTHKRQSHKEWFGAKNMGCVLVTVAVTLVLVAVGCIWLQGQMAETVIYGSVYTGVDGETATEAVAMRGDKIIYVGTREGVKDYINNKTKILDYGDQTVMAGITDSHTHINMATEAAEYQVNISEGQSVEDYVRMIREYVAAHPDNDMYVGTGWNHDFFGAAGPSKEILDAISVDKPIYIKSLDAHSVWVNSKMLEMTGVTRETSDPDGGKIERDAEGNPSGCFRETAVGIYLKPHLKLHSIDEYKEMILKSQAEYASLGYTAYVEVFIDPDEANYNLYRAYEELDQAGQLSLRVHAAWTVNNNDQALDTVRKIAQYSREAKGGMFELTEIKIFADGVAETGTAYLSEPYANDPESYGLNRWPGEEGFQRMVDCVTLAHKNGLAAHFHAMGDAAVTQSLDAIEAAKKQYNNTTIRDVITHLELVKESDRARFKELGVVASANLIWGVKVPGTYKDVEVAHLGEERAAEAYPYKSLADAGAVVSFATDYPPGTAELPMLAFHVGISRAALGIIETTRNADETFSRDGVLRVMTYGGAYQMNQETIRGTLEAGKKADVIVMNMNLLKVSANEALYGEALLTMVDGKKVYIAN